MNKKTAKTEIKNLLELLSKEKEEDLSQFRGKMLNISLSARREEGICWYPVFVEKTTFTQGDRLLVKISRLKEHNNAHMFQSGKLISLFTYTKHNKEKRETVTGVINYVKEHEMLITLNSDKIPLWIKNDRLGVQLLFDENSYREMEKALNCLLNTEEKRINELMNILLGDVVPVFDNRPLVQYPMLNHSQQKAMMKIQNARDLAIIHGPPGTGKTTTLVQAIIQALQESHQVLVCAPSNTAVDLLVEKLSAHEIRTVRIGHPARVTEEILSLTLDARVARHTSYKDLKSIRRKAEEYRKKGLKYRQSFVQADRERWKIFLSESRKLKGEAEQLEFYITNQILSGAQVIATTLVGAANYVLKGRHFHSVFIDEAAQALEPACWIPLIRSDRVIFAGDHNQLPPTIKSHEAARGGLEVTLFEKAITRNDADVMLLEQYRMNIGIMNFSNRYFYKNQLKANKKVANWKLFDDDQPMVFIDTTGCGFFEQTDPETHSSFNPEEATLLQTHFISYLNTLETLKKQSDVQHIGIISPYKAQVSILENFLQKEGVLPEWISGKLAISTIDSFQGQERDIIYISLVRSNERGEIGFLSDIRRMNVAMTRARKKLVIIGDSGTIGQHDFYGHLLDYVNETGAYQSAIEYLY